MELLKLWEGRTGRLPYLAALIISSAAIVVLPFIAGKITMAYAAGMDPAMAIVRALLLPLLLGIGLIVIGGSLLFFARRRLRELGLSGVWLLLFPISPLLTLFTFAVASTSLGMLPLPITSPITGLPFWFEMAFGVLLAVLPSGDYLEQILRFAHFATTCEGRLGRRTFLLHLAIVLGLMIIMGGFGIFGLARGLASPGVQSVSILSIVLDLASVLLTVFLMMFVTASTIKRLHDLNQKGWWIILFPFGLPSSLFILTFLVNPPMLAALLMNPITALSIVMNPFTALSIVQGLGCLILLVRLFSKRGSDVDNPYGLSVHPPDLSPSSA